MEWRRNTFIMAGRTLPAIFEHKKCAKIQKNIVFMQNADKKMIIRQK